MKVVRIRVYDDENYIIEYIYMTNNIDKAMAKFKVDYPEYEGFEVNPDLFDLNNKKNKQHFKIAQECDVVREV